MAGRTSHGSLADAIRGWDDATVRRLFGQRPDLATPVPADTTQLVSRASTRASLMRILDRLDRFELAVLEGLAALSESSTPAVLARLLQAPAPGVQQTLGHLHGLALVWPDGRGWRLVRAVGDVLGPHPAGLGPWSRDPRLSSPERIEALVEAVGGDARQVLDRLTWGPPTGRVSNLRPAVDVASADSPIERLLAHGLLVAADPRTVVLPREVGLHLRGGRLLPEPVHVPPALSGVERAGSLADRTAAGAAFELVRRIEVLLEHWATEPPAVLRGGGIGVRDLRAAAQLLGVDETSAALHIELARDASLLGSGDDEDHDEAWLPTVAFDAWLDRPAAGRWATLATAWLATRRTYGLIGRRDDRGRPVNPLAPDLERTITPDTRRVCLRVLASATTAPPLEEIMSRVAWERPRRAGLRDDVVRWTLREAAAIGVSGLGVMSGFGRELVAGGAVESALEPLLPATVDHVVLQADLTAVAPGPLDSDLSADLALCAEVESRGGATVYRFTEGSVRRALDAGWSAARVHAFLSARSRTPVPQPLAYLVDDVARKHGRLRVGVAESYLRCDDPATLAGVLADPRSAALRLRRVGDTVLVTDVPVELVLDRLRELGHAPVAEAADGSVRGLGAAPRRRAPSPARRTTPRVHEVVGGDQVDLDRVVAALRAGDRAAAVRPEPVPGMGAADPSRVVVDLRSAAETGGSVWLRYVDQHGGLIERVVDPVRVEGGWLTAHDHRVDELRTFAVHRIRAVSVVSSGRR
jgi:hypothetical protein